MDTSLIKWKLKQKFPKLLTPNKTKVFFLHIPKTGGTSLDKAIRKHYRHSFSRIDDHSSYKAAKMLCDVDIEKGEMGKLLRFREQLVTYEMFKQTQYISGHVSYNRDNWSKFHQDYIYVTCLRHPVKKYLSNYFYNAFKESEHFKIKQDLATFLATPRAQEVGFEYVRYFAGISESDCSSPKAIALAKENLDKLTIVGFLDNLADFKAKFQQHTGIKLNINHQRKNPVQNPNVDDETMAKITKICAPDLELYEYARNKFWGK